MVQEVVVAEQGMVKDNGCLIKKKPCLVYNKVLAAIKHFLLFF